MKANSTNHYDKEYTIREMIEWRWASHIGTGNWGCISESELVQDGKIGEVYIMDLLESMEMMEWRN